MALYSWDGDISLVLVEAIFRFHHTNLRVLLLIPLSSSLPINFFKHIKYLILFSALPSLPSIHDDDKFRVLLQMSVYEIYIQHVCLCISSVFMYLSLKVPAVQIF